MSCLPILLTPDDDIHLNALSPYALRYTVTSDDAAFDLSTVSAATFEVKRPDGSITSWAGLALQNVSAISIDLVRVFVSGDVDLPGLYAIEPRMTTPSGEFIAAVKILKVRDAFE